MKLTKRQRTKLRRIWEKNLESGKFQQGTNQLRRGERWCCLGVAIQTAIDLGYLKDQWVYDPQLGYYRYDRSTLSLPPEMVDMLGLVDHLGTPKSGRGLNLTNLNDGTSEGGDSCRRLNFKGIARELRKGRFYKDDC